LLHKRYGDYWYYWKGEGDSYESSELSTLKFESDKEYDLRKLGWFEWAGCVWNEPMLFAYNKWKHLGHPAPILVLVPGS